MKNYDDWVAENEQYILYDLTESFAATDYAWDYINLIEFHEALNHMDGLAIFDMFEPHRQRYAKEHLEIELLRRWQKFQEERYDE